MYNNTNVASMESASPAHMGHDMCVAMNDGPQLLISSIRRKEKVCVRHMCVVPSENIIAPHTRCCSAEDLIRIEQPSE